MAEIHILNVGQGDCTVFKSNSGHITMFDICGGNKEYDNEPNENNKSLLSLLDSINNNELKSNNRMCEKAINPLSFILNKLKSKSIFRFILSHPDMDHLDGFSKLISNFNVINFWDSGVRREEPDFSSNNIYKKEDWDAYVKVRDGRYDDIKVISPKQGDKNKYFNEDDDGGKGDCISIYAPNQNLIDAANNLDDSTSINDASYVIVYRSSGGRILLPGDAHDKTWEIVLEKYADKLVGCEVMLAPHHGRDSNRLWEFLDVIKPKFSILGCASSKHLAYNEWNNRGLEKITQNQAGHIGLYPKKDGIEVFIENGNFAENNGGNLNKTDNYGNYFYKKIEKK